MPTKIELEAKIAELEAEADESGLLNENERTEITAVGDATPRFLPLPIDEAMIEIMRRVPAIGKSAKNVKSGYAARSIDDVLDELHRIMADVGVYLLPNVVSADYETYTNDKGKIVTDVRIVVKYRFVAYDGSSQSIVMATEGRDWADKATTKALSNALKYGLIQTFLIPLTEGSVDPDTETIEVDAAPETTEVDAAPEMTLDEMIDASEHPDWIAKAEVLASADGDEDQAAIAWDAIRMELGYHPTEEITAAKAKKIVAELQK